MSKGTKTIVSDLMEDLFNGKIYPAEQITSKSPRCREVEKELTAEIASLENTLDKETYAKIDHACDLFIEEADIMRRKALRIMLQNLAILSLTYRVRVRKRPLLPISYIMGTEYFKCGLVLGLQLMQESQEIVKYLGRTPDVDEVEEDS